MSDAEYTRINQMNVTQLAALGAWELVRYMERSNHVQRQMMLQLLRGKKS